jgi:plasmid stability protein
MRLAARLDRTPAFTTKETSAPGIGIDRGGSLPLPWFHNGVDLEPSMPVNLSIKNAPDDVVQRLKARAARHHRSLQGELLVILEEAVQPTRQVTVDEVLAEVRRLQLTTPAESAVMVRADRDAR